MQWIISHQLTWQPLPWEKPRSDIEITINKIAGSSLTYAYFTWPYMYTSIWKIIWRDYTVELLGFPQMKQNYTTSENSFPCLYYQKWTETHSIKQTIQTYFLVSLSQFQYFFMQWTPHLLHLYLSEILVTTLTGSLFKASSEYRFKYFYKEIP
jgi:hypothetical protein